tara:strand:+ start:2455 stop:2757 length:303 start_codon:yes stop_codon:yes gene_type:complete
MKLKGETRLKKFKAGSFNKSRNNNTTFSNNPKVQKDNTTIDETVNKYVKKKDKSSLGIKLKKVRKTRLKRHITKAELLTPYRNIEGDEPYGEGGGSGGGG